MVTETVKIHGIVVPKELENRILKNRLYRSITRDIEKDERTIQNTPKTKHGAGFAFLDVMLAGGKNLEASAKHNEKLDDLKKSVEEMKLSRVDLIEEILEDEKEKQRIIDASKVNVDQTVVHGDYVDDRDTTYIDDRDTIVKDSVVNKSRIGAGGDDKFAKLKELKEMFDSGFISNEEMEEMKKDIMGK
jgi:hypothetical protein